MSQEVFKVLNDRDHTLLRGHIMLGSMVEEPYELYINGKLTTLNIVPALIKVVFEMIDNTIDEHYRSNKRYATKVNIKMTPLSLTVEDNGRGIPVEYYQLEDGTKELRPVLCWTKLRSGTSFENHESGPSANGVGSSVAVIFSNFFSGETCDGKKYCKVTASDNMGNVNSFVDKANGRPKGTKVMIEPDFERFGVNCFTLDHITVVKERILALSAIYKTITFTFNDEKIKTKKSNEYLEIYNKPYVGYYSDNYFFGIMPTDVDEYYNVTYLEGLYVKNGGTIETYISREISYALRDVIKKKHKLEMSPGEIKRGLLLIFNGCMFPNMKFDSQTKERMVNSEAEVKAYIGDVNFEKIAKDIMNVPAIIEPIIEAKLAKQLAAEKRAVTMAQKKQKKVFIEKYIPAKSKNPNDKNLYLCEGLSAASQALKVRDVNRHSFYPLRGMPLNVWDLKESKIIENKEMADVMAILGLTFGMTEKEIRYNITHNKICLLADADADGVGGINPLLINFFYLWPDLFKMGMIYIVPSPRYIIYDNYEKKNEKRTYCYTKEEFEQKYQKGKVSRYIKGLGGLEPIEYKEMLDDEKKYIRVELDDVKCLEIMFSPNAVDERRKIMEI